MPAVGAVSEGIPRAHCSRLPPMRLGAARMEPATGHSGSPSEIRCESLALRLDSTSSHVLTGWGGHHGVRRTYPARSLSVGFGNRVGDVWCLWEGGREGRGGLGGRGGEGDAARRAISRGAVTYSAPSIGGCWDPCHVDMGAEGPGPEGMGCVSAHTSCTLRPPLARGRPGRAGSVRSG